jgi:hypothetical protein
MAGLMLDQPPGFWIIGLLDKIPHLAFRVAESGKGAQVFHVSQHHRRTLDCARLFSVRLAAGRFGAVELNLLVRTVAERFVPGLAAASSFSFRLFRSPRQFAVSQANFSRLSLQPKTSFLAARFWPANDGHLSGGRGETLRRTDQLKLADQFLRCRPSVSLGHVVIGRHDAAHLVTPDDRSSTANWGNSRPPVRTLSPLTTGPVLLIGVIAARQHPGLRS